MRKEISEKIKVLSFFMTCAMVFYHAPKPDSAFAMGAFDEGVNNLINYMTSTMGTLVMSYFFTVTGFLMFHNFSLKTYPIKIKRRLFSLLIPYVLWQCIIVVIDVFQKQYVFSMPDFLQKTFCLVAWPIDGAMWYVYAVFLMALISPIVLLLLKNKKVGWFFILAVIIWVEARDRISNPIVVQIITHGYVSNILFYLPCYLVGAFYGKFADENTTSDSLIYILSAVFMAFLLEGTFNGMLSHTTIKMMPMAILYLLPVCSVLKNKWIYSVTFLMYAIHQPLIGDLWSPVVRVYREISLPATVHNIFTKVIILSIDIILAIVIYTVLKKIAPKVLKALTGNRT